MELKELKNIKDYRLVTSTESICYIYKDKVYKVFNSDINVKDRLDVISIFMSNCVNGCPIIYDFIYDKGKAVGYFMKYYKGIVPLSKIDKFRFIKEKCLELIDIYLTLKEQYNLCYFDFNPGNVFINEGNILLLDIDSCLTRDIETEEISKQALVEFILSVIYKTYFFEYEIYFTFSEREQIRNILCEKFTGDTIDSIKDFVSTVSKTETKKVLRKIPYKIT